MNISLLNSALLAFTALLAVPVLAHLFAKAKPREFPFPSLQWLRRVERQTTRLRRPKDRLLLAMRLLAVAAVIAAFLQPLLFQEAGLASANARKTVVIIMDRSASMGFVEQGQSRFARGSALADDVLKGAGSQTLANIVWLDAAPDAEFPDPAVNVNALRDVLRRARVTQEAGEVNEALRVALDQLGRGEGAKELYLVSDYQTAAWKSVTLSVPPNVKLYHLKATTGDATNAALASLAMQPERPVAGTDVRVLARVRNFSPAELKTTVQMAFGEARQSRPVTLPPWGEGVAEFRVPAGAAGLQSVTASLPEDAFPSDDRRFATVEIRESWRVKLDGPPNDPSLAMWRRGLGALGWLDLQGAAANPDVHIAVRANPAQAATLREAAERGALVICQPGDDWNGSAWMAFWNAAAKEAAIQAAKRDRVKDQPWTMQTTRDDHAMWAIFRSGEYGDPAAGHVWQRLQMKVPTEQMLIRYDDGVPAIAAQQVGKGWLVLWNLELDESVSDRVQQPSFLVLLGELLLQHGESGSASLSRFFVPPQKVAWEPSQPVAPDQVRLLDESGAEEAIVNDTAGSLPVFNAREALAPGNYKWVLDGQTSERASVNFPADAESDLRTIDPSTLATGSTLSLSAAAALAAGRDGLPLWPWCLGIALLLLLLESLIARSAVRAPETTA